MAAGGPCVEGNERVSDAGDGAPPSEALEMDPAAAAPVLTFASNLSNMNFRAKCVRGAFLHAITIPSSSSRVDPPLIFCD